LRNLRKIQLGAIDEPVIIQQDHDLIEYIRQNNITEAGGFGDIDYFREHVRFVDYPTNFGIVIINASYYQFGWLKKYVNNILENKIQSGGILYLAINKFLATNDTTNYGIAQSDYDLAIEEFIRSNINATVELYLYHPNDRGQNFNFIHPLTRFYLRK
jgi:hypothetical protein